MGKMNKLFEQSPAYRFPVQVKVYLFLAMSVSYYKLEPSKPLKTCSRIRFCFVTLQDFLLLNLPSYNSYDQDQAREYPHRPHYPRRGTSMLLVNQEPGKEQGEM